MSEDLDRTVTVGQNDSLTSISRSNGYLWRTVWDYGKNGALRQKRPQPNQLVPGDEVVLPPKGDKSVSKPTDALHKFKFKGEPARLKFQLMCMGEPRANLRYTLSYGDQVIHGTTDGEGKLDEPLDGKVQSAQLLLPDSGESYQIAVGALEPVQQLRGVQQRLSNLGYDCPSTSGELDSSTQKAIAAFQKAEKLQETGQADAATCARLEQRHG